MPKVSRHESAVKMAKVHVCKLTVEGASRPASRMAAKTSSGISRSAKLRTLRRFRMTLSNALSLQRRRHAEAFRPGCAGGS